MTGRLPFGFGSLTNPDSLRLTRGFLFGGLAVAMISWAGCQSKSQPGGPGSVEFAGKQPVGPTAEDIFTLVVPSTPVTIHRAGDTDLTIGIKRGQTFAQEVLVKFADLPAGVTAEPREPLIKRGQETVSVRLKAAGDAPLGTTSVRVYGNPYHGPQAENRFKLEVVK